MDQLPFLCMAPGKFVASGDYMKQPGTSRKVAAGLAAAGLFVGSAAGAAEMPARTVDPLVAVSLLGTASSQAAVCAAGTASAAAAGAAQGVAGQQGCVLPVVDTPPPPPVTQAPPAMVPVAAHTSSIGVIPLLLGLAAIVGGAALLLDGDDDVDIELPFSPN